MQNRTVVNAGESERIASRMLRKGLNHELGVV
jgi:hypothetical protein